MHRKQEAAIKSLSKVLCMAELACVICSFKMLTQEAPTDLCARDAEHDAHSVLYLKIQPFQSNALRITDSLDLSNSCS